MPGACSNQDCGQDSAAICLARCRLPSHVADFGGQLNSSYAPSPFAEFVAHYMDIVAAVLLGLAYAITATLIFVLQQG